MKKGLLLLAFVPLFSIGLSSCSPVTSDLTSEEMVSRDKLMADNNDHIASDNSVRFDSSFPNTYQANLEYEYYDYYKHNYYSINSTPSEGNIDFLVIPVTFSDYNLKNSDTVREEIYKCYFADSDELAFESVSSYFWKSSYHNLSIGGYVTDWYASSYTTRITLEETEELVKDAVEWAKHIYKDKIDFKSLDKDQDGYLDAVCLIYNAPNSYRGNDNLWAYSSWVYSTSSSKNNPTPRSFFFASYDFMYENSANNPLDAHTYIHEAGHLIGLDDYYDYAKSGYAGASGGGIMQSHNVGDHDPYSKMALGWIKPLVVSGESEITIKPFTTTGQVVVLTNKDNFSSPFDEYVMIDLYTNDDLNEYDSLHRFGGNNALMPLLPTESGIRIWHVDGRLGKYNRQRSDYEEATTIEPNGYYNHLTSNSTGNGYECMEKEYRNYRLLQLFQRNLVNTFEKSKGTFFSEKDMFKAGDLFSISRYKVLTANKGYLNNGTELNYSVEILSVSDEEAKIKVRVL